MARILGRLRAGDLLASRREPLRAAGSGCRHRPGPDDARRQGHRLSPTSRVFLVTFVARAFFDPWCSSTSSACRREAVFETAASGSSSRTCSCTTSAGFTHILFNMLALWMFGVELERRWGTQRVREVLRHHRHRRGRRHGAGVAAAVRRRRAPSTGDHDRRVGRDLRPADGVGAAVSAPADSVHVHLPAAGARGRAAHGRDVRSSPPSSGANGSVAEATHLGGLVDRLAVPEGLLTTCGSTSATGWRDGAWNACAGSSTSTKAARTAMGQHDPLTADPYRQTHRTSSTNVSSIASA